MVTGQVGFHDSKLVIKYRVEKRDRPMVKALNKTKTEAVDPPLKGQRAERDLEVTRARKARKKRMMKEEAKRKAAMRAKKEAMDYNRVFEVSDMTAVLILLPLLTHRLRFPMRKILCNVYRVFIYFSLLFLVVSVHVFFFLSFSIQNDETFISSSFSQFPVEFHSFLGSNHIFLKR